MWLAMGTSLPAQEYSAKRSVTRRFPVSRETTLEVHNKYGKVQTVTWNRDSVAVEVEIILSEASVSKLNKLKEEISIEFSGTRNYIIARSKFKSETGRIAEELKSVSHTLGGSDNHVEINYMVYLPEYLDLVVNNKFGDVYLDQLTGQVDVELSNGVLNGSGISGNANINLSFASGTIKSLGSCTMQLSYSEFELGEAGQLDLVSKSSRLDADSVNVLKINSRRDKLYFQRVEYLYGNSNFSEVKVFDFLRECDLYMKYGKLSIDNVVAGFSKIHVESEYTDLSLSFDREATFAFDILHHTKSVLKLPPGRVNAEEVFDGKEHFRTSGALGSTDPSGQVAIDALQKCFINLSIK
jgi:hypothetical protein